MIRKVALSSIFAVLTSLGAQLSLYIGPVPITLQSLFVILSGIMGPAVGFFSQTLYLALGFAGLPVFAGFKGGPSVLLGPTAGYLISFPIAAASAGLIYNPAARRRMIRALLACMSAEAIIYALGVPWLIVWLSTFTTLTLSEAIYRGLVMGSLIFLPGDGLKIAFILYLLRRKDFQQIVMKARS